jgi:hypothetical protein
MHTRPPGAIGIHMHLAAEWLNLHLTSSVSPCQNWPNKLLRKRAGCWNMPTWLLWHPRNSVTAQPFAVACARPLCSVVSASARFAAISTSRSASCTCSRRLIIARCCAVREGIRTRPRDHVCAGERWACRTLAGSPPPLRRESPLYSVKLVQSKVLFWCQCGGFFFEPVISV